MDTPFDADLRDVLETYPWLVDLMRNADWKPCGDGMVEFHAVVPARSDTREAVTALAHALRLELDEAAAES